MFREKTVFRQPSHILGIFTSVLLLLALVVPLVQAQEDTQTYSFASGDAFVTFTPLWNLEVNDNGSVTLTQSETLVTLYAPSYVAEQVSLTESSTTVDVLQGMWAILSSDTQTRFDESRLRSAILPNLHTLSLYPYVPENSSLTGLFAAILLSDGNFSFADAVFPLSDAEQSQQDVLNLLGGFESISRGICTISTNQVNTVQVRVGPGLNRSVITFLPANRDFTVLGRAAIELDGSTPYPPCMYRCGPGENRPVPIWWRLDRSEVAPQSAAAELWVAASDVNTSPGCDSSVPFADPPTLVPFRTQTPVTPGAPEILSTPTSPFDPLCPGSTSAAFVGVMWNTRDFTILSACMTNLRVWEPEAAAQQASRGPICDVQPTAEQRDDYFYLNWALTDVGTGYFILGMRYKEAGRINQSRQAFNTVLGNYSCGWVWDPRGYFWWLRRGALDNMP